jgi:hypothetical protein
VPVLVERIPAGLQPRPRQPHGILHKGAVDGVVEALAVDAHGRGDDHPLHGIIDELLEQHRRAEVVHRHVAVDRVHALADADFGGEVDNLVDPRQCAPHRDFVAHVAADELHLGIEPFWG